MRRRGQACGRGAAPDARAQLEAAAVTQRTRAQYQRTVDRLAEFAASRGANAVEHDTALAFLAQRLADASLRPASVSKVVAAIRWGARNDSGVAFVGTFAGPEWSAAVRRLIGGAVRRHPSMAAPARLATPLSFLVAQPLLQRLHAAGREGRSLRIPLARKRTPSRRAGATAPAAFAYLTSDAADVLWGLVVLGKALFLRKKEAADLRMADVQTMRRQDIALLRVTFPASKMQGRRSAAAGPAADFTDSVSGAEFTICGPHMSAHGDPVEWVLRRQGREGPSAGRGAAQPVFPAIVRRAVLRGVEYWDTVGRPFQQTPRRGEISAILTAVFAGDDSARESFSLRSGGVSDAMRKLGLSIDETARRGRWASVETVRTHYFRLPGEAYVQAVVAEARRGTRLSE